MKIKNQKEWPLVTILLPVFQAMKFLPISLPSILDLDYPNLEILVIDDASTDGSGDYIEKNFPQLKLIRQPVNKGLDFNTEMGFWMTKGKYFFWVNQDTVHSPDYLKKCVSILEENAEIGAITGKIYKYDFEKNQPTNVIDTVGEMIYKSRRVIDEGQGVEDIGQFDQAGEVFAISGQNPLYRRRALEEIAVPVHGLAHPEVWDQDFLMYKEDVDIGWRLRLFGWKAWYEPSAVAWHGRGTAAVKREKKVEIAKNRHLISKFIKYHSIKNRYFLIFKNDLPGLYLRHIPSIWWNEILYFGHNLVFDTANIKAYFAALSKMPKMLKKRHWIMKHKKITDQQMAKWFKK